MDNKLKKLMVWIRSFSRDEQAQGMVEYGLILALVSIVVVGSLGVIGDKVNSAFDDVGQSLVGNFDEALAGTHHEEGNREEERIESVSLFSATNDETGERDNRREKNQVSSEDNEQSWTHIFNSELRGDSTPNDMAWIVGGIIGVFLLLGFAWKLFF